MSQRDVVDTEVLVVGSGPSGLAAAYRLHQAGHRVQVLEARDEFGGKMQTVRRDGYLFERGPVIIPSAYENLVALIREVGLGDDLIPAGSAVGFARGDEVHFLRSDHLFLDAVRTRMLSLRGKLSVVKLMADSLRSRRLLSYEDLSRAADIDTETVAQYARRRGVSAEVLEYVVDSSIRAMIATRSDRISVVELYFTLNKLLGTKLYALREGMGSYPERIAQLVDVRCNARVTSVRERADSVELAWVDAEGVAHRETAAACVLAIDANTTAGLLPQLDDWRRAFLTDIEYFRVVTVNVGLTCPPPNNPAFIVQIPKSVHPGLIGIMMEHNKASNRVPAGRGLLGLYTTAEWAEELYDQPDEVVVREMVGAADQVVPGIAATVEWTRVNRWDPVMVYSRPGLYRDLVRFNEIRDRDDRRIQLAGDYFSSSNMNSATAAGERAARELARVLGAKPAIR